MYKGHQQIHSQIHLEMLSLEQVQDLSEMDWVHMERSFLDRALSMCKATYVPCFGNQISPLLTLPPFLYVKLETLPLACGESQRSTIEQGVKSKDFVKY